MDDIDYPIPFIDLIYLHSTIFHTGQSAVGGGGGAGVIHEFFL